MTEERIETLEQLLKRFNMPTRGWDLVLVGDGSGSRWNNPGGWACTMIMRDRKSGKIHYLTPFVGGVSRGPINWLEAMPYWHCIRHHYHDMGGKQMCETGGVVVHAVTDSMWVARSMSGRNKLKIHNDMLMLFNWYKKAGYQIWWHHFPREVVRLNSVADRLSANARAYIGAIEPPIVSDEFPIS